MELWHNGTGEKGPAVFEKAVSDFEAAHSNVKINITIVQNEDFDGKLQTAMAGGTTPDIFLQRGGGKLNDQVKADQVMDITSLIDPQVKSEIGGNWALETLDSKIYAVPMSLQPEGFWYSGNLFKDAGVDAKSITDMTSLSAAVDKLKASSKSAISLGGKDAWPAAHWFYQFALRQCSKDVIQGLVGAQNFDDPCWLAALQSLADFAKTEPFNSGFLTTAAQQGAGSSAGMVANYQAAMELMGAWEVGVIGGLTPDKKNLPDLGFFPFPKVDGGKGDQAAMMAGADAYSCSIKAPKECADFLNFLGAKAQQEGFSEAFSQIPANSTASGKVTDPALKAAADALAKSPYTVLWIDSALGQDTGNAVNAAVVALLAGSADPAAALAQMQKAF
ncbi:MAG: extracellular solute-binding protein [Propionibacteriaceae bacterium]|nr:extracellular solute-binding protein [Propionibacteriaceae bacterium]